VFISYPLLSVGQRAASSYPPASMKFCCFRCSMFVTYTSTLSSH